MSTAFTKTLQSLKADRFRGRAMALTIGCLALICWVWWATTSSVTVNGNSGSQEVISPLQFFLRKAGVTKGS